MMTSTTLKTIGRISCCGLLAAAAVGLCAQSKPSPDGAIRLIVRGDDIGSSHAANLACIQSFREGIVRSVEVMVPAPWFPEAVRMLKDNPGLDVGVHLTLTSEWDNCKWRPLTGPSSITDADGILFPDDGPAEGFSAEYGFS